MKTAAAPHYDWTAMESLIDRMGGEVGYDNGATLEIRFASKAEADAFVAQAERLAPKAQAERMKTRVVEIVCPDALI